MGLPKRSPKELGSQTAWQWESQPEPEPGLALVQRLGVPSGVESDEAWPKELVWRSGSASRMESASGSAQQQVAQHKELPQAGRFR